MAIKYNAHSILELFNSEPIVIDSEAEIYKYQINDKAGFELILYFSVYDQNVTVRLEHKGLENPIFDVEIKNVKEIKADREKLVFFKQEKYEPAIQVIISPSFMLDFSF
ncbi:hypothetical protein [Paenibacillus larvae]|uniref:Uncharacterized protein n=1 Tax=Paenibacillus larvae subsp. larvae TaxID=147375 RepID=A0A6C0QQL7_9BACL|nr:hypothetical protein [Paenibacillus larvae]MCY7478755.1 hypothetical protein [Paenibacillus larvae]MDE5165351.1 hypothetical protein [Paenibacillus larvae subsp. larvae]QHZ51035.1 hypothetical protein ERICV_01885 [Paenibacillus larvae subsp. larvae]